ncbi:SUN domain-containing protein 2-like [Athene cunicularia]|uniref:SUN domain-containing protein 2-like n=1 Tax=Athene cunicularia TaxID=194338 RepID=UPI000EF6EFAF|nr:SUN domain-containing protein 2-like [Athene cunicularia]
MARRKAPQRRCQGASKGSLGNKANPQPTGEASRSSGNLCVEVKLVTDAREPAECSKAMEVARMVFGLACRLPGALVSLGRLLSMFIFAAQKMASQKKRFLQAAFLFLAVALAGGNCWTSLPLWSMHAKGLVEELTRVSLAHLETLRNLPALWFKEPRKLDLLLEEVAQLKAELNSAEKLYQEVQDSKQAVPSEVCDTMFDWALKSSGAAIDTQRTSETYSCREDGCCRVQEWFFLAKPLHAILEPDVLLRNCWPLQGHRGQVVIRLPARVHLTAVTMQYKASLFGTVTSAPRDVSVFGLDTDGEEEVLLVMFTYDVTKEAIQTFPLKVCSTGRGGCQGANQACLGAHGRGV